MDLKGQQGAGGAVRGSGGLARPRGFESQARGSEIMGTKKDREGLETLFLSGAGLLPKMEC